MMNNYCCKYKKIIRVMFITEWNSCNAFVKKTSDSIKLLNSMDLFQKEYRYFSMAISLFLQQNYFT